MTTLSSPALSAPGPGRSRAIRTSALLGAAGPLMAAAYLLASPEHRHRSAMLAVIGGMLAVLAVGWWAARVIAPSRWRLPAQVLGIVATIAGLAALGVLDGGAGTPLGELLPFYLIYLAVLVPPRVFFVAGALDLAAYAVVAGTGRPVPPAYPVLCSIAFAGVALLALRHAGALASLRRRLAEISRTDALTGCLNRRGFDRRFAEELAAADLAGTPLTLVLVDLDLFKEINDSYGHRTGDDLLTWVGHTLRQGVRRRDVVGRLGGDEFAVLLPDTAPEDAAVVVRRLRAALGVAAPASIGIAAAPADGVTAADLTRLADVRLYRDKAVRERRTPTAGAVAEACARLPVQTPASVSRLERRRHSIADTGLVSALKGAVAMSYLLVFAPQHPHQVAIAALALDGIILGVLAVALADRLSRSGRARAVMTGLALCWYGSAAAVAALDGGVGSPLAAGLLCSIPLIMLGTRLRAALPIFLSVCVAYVVMAVVQGAPSTWYVVIHLMSMVVVSAACAAQGLAAARQRALVTRLSERDALTGCLNRRGFTERFTAAIGDAHRAGSRPTLMIFDLDGFKQLNDTAGHAEGDDLLRWVGATLQAGVRRHDLVGRLGGDEFVVLTGADPDGGAEPTAEDLRRALARRTPASVGTAAFGRHGDDFDTLYGHADARLYEQKARRPRRTPAGAPGSGP
ncbi:diguanylate cyclase [Actinoplanes sp. NPDC049681]|uniref:diguanylate cyclase n=1 Tax=Actinoplanes sp. NPDC049681 TaxID=3363905 RepID=UPI0037B31584